MTGENGGVVGCSVVEEMADRGYSHSGARVSPPDHDCKSGFKSLLLDGSLVGR